MLVTLCPYHRANRGKKSEQNYICAFDDSRYNFLHQVTRTIQLEGEVSQSNCDSGSIEGSAERLTGQHCNCCPPWW